DLNELAQTCTYDELPQFLAEHREYASRSGFGMPRGTPEEEERFGDLLAKVQAVETSGVPNGLEL
ncbi:uncharacterized protein METZ01_LOCUS349314, partial [marine metagenome]